MINRHPVTVYYEDTDAGGVVYYANYLKFAERGRTEYLRQIGYENSRIFAENGVLFVVRHIEADYLKPARLDDRLTVQTALLAVKNSSFVMEQSIIRSEKDGDVTVFTMTVTLACVDSAGKVAPLPKELKNLFVLLMEKKD